MMPGRVVTSPRSWYRNIAICSRRQTFTTVTCLLLLTVYFTYITLNSNGHGVELKPSAGKSATVRQSARAAIHKTGGKSTRDPRGRESSQASELVVSGIKEIRENDSNKEKYIAVIADALKLPNGNNMRRDYQPTAALTANEISNVGILPEVDHGQISTANNPDSNSIEGSLILETEKDISDIRGLSKDDQYRYLNNGDYYDDNNNLNSVSNASSDYPVTTDTTQKDDNHPVSRLQSHGIKTVVRDRVSPITLVNSKSDKTLPGRPALERPEKPAANRSGSINTAKATPSVTPKSSSPASYSLDEYDSDEQADNCSWPTETARSGGRRPMTMQEEIAYDPQEVDLLSVVGFQKLNHNFLKCLKFCRM